MQRDEEGNIEVTAMVQVSIPVNLLLTAEQYANPEFVRRAAAENFICHPAVMLNPDGPTEDTVNELVTGGWLDSVIIDGRNWANPDFQPEPLPAASGEQEYTVRWEIEIEAGSPQDAAAQALDIQRDPDATATVFDVVDAGGKIIQVDVAQLALPVAN